MKSENKVLIYAMLSYMMPILAFGDFSVFDSFLGKFCYNYVTLSISIPVLFFLLKRKSKGKKFQYYLTCVLLGVFMSTFRLLPFSTHSNDTLMGLSFTGSNIIGYWICFLSFISFYMRYKTLVEIKYKNDFLNDPILINRDEKINKILNF